MRKGWGKRPNISSGLTKEKVEKFEECEQFGSHSSLAIRNTLWWMFESYFGSRGRRECYTMKTEDFTIERDQKANEYVKFPVGITKN